LAARLHPDPLGPDSLAAVKRLGPPGGRGGKGTGREGGEGRREGMEGEGRVGKENG